MNLTHYVRRTCGALVVLTAVAAAAACATDSRGRTYVRIGPPAPIVEVRAVVPGAGYVWVGGYQRWDGDRYQWEPGRWARPPRPRARWEEGHWAHDRRGSYYVEGRWR